MFKIELYQYFNDVGFRHENYENFWLNLQQNHNSKLTYKDNELNEFVEVNNFGSIIKYEYDLCLTLKGKYVPYTVSELVHDDGIVFEPTYYTYDYTYENPLIFSTSYSDSDSKLNYIYLNNRLVQDSKTNNSYLYDGKYSVSEVISKDNTLSLRYDIYGNILTPLSQEDKTFSYNTLEYTPQNRLYYIKARYYDYKYI